MASGIISVTSIPGWPTPPEGIMNGCEQALSTAGFAPNVTCRPDGIFVSDVPTVQAFLSSYSGSQSQLDYNKAQKQAQLDALFDANFDLTKFIRNGTLTNVTATNVGNFLATITNNYRSLRSQIANASTLSVLNAININSGWPSNA